MIGRDGAPEQIAFSSIPDASRDADRAQSII
jgi:hypothetical protein